MSDYIVDRIPDGLRIQPDAGGQGRQGKRDRKRKRSGEGDSITISEEAKRRSEQREAEDAEGS